MILDIDANLYGSPLIVFRKFDALNSRAAALSRVVKELVESEHASEAKRYCFLSPTNQTAKAIWWKDIITLVSQHFTGIISSDVSRSIKFRSGSEIYFAGFKSPYRIEGISWNGIIVDANEQFGLDLYRQHILPCLIERHGWCWVDGAEETVVDEFRKYAYRPTVCQ